MISLEHLLCLAYKLIGTGSKPLVSGEPSGMSPAFHRPEMLPGAFFALPSDLAHSKNQGRISKMIWNHTLARSCLPPTLRTRGTGQQYVVELDPDLIPHVTPHRITMLGIPFLFTYASVVSYRLSGVYPQNITRSICTSTVSPCSCGEDFEVTLYVMSVIY